MLFSARLATYDDQAKEAGIPASVLKEAYAAATERRKAGPPQAAEDKQEGSS